MSENSSLLEWVSPSAVQRLQSCGLAESRRRSAAYGARPSNPIARLGDAAHRVLEWIAQTAPDLAADAELEVVIAQRWRDEVAVEVASANGNALEPPHGPVERWPKYGHIAAALKVDGAALARELKDLPPEKRRAEHELSSRDGRIRGKADLIIIGDDGDALIIDHKMGDVGEHDLEHGGRYEQQLLLYVAMARDSGIAASSAEIRPIGRPPARLALSEDRLAAAVEEAHHQMDRYNEAVTAGRALEIATPSESSCSWCPYILDCAAIWGDQPPDLGDIRCLEGQVNSVQRLHGSSAASLHTREGDVVAVGLPRQDVHGRPLIPGDAVRITGLRASPTRGHMKGGHRTLLRVLD